MINIAYVAVFPSREACESKSISQNEKEKGKKKFGEKKKEGGCKSLSISIGGAGFNS